MKGYEQAREILKHLANCAKNESDKKNRKKHMLLVLTGNGSALESALRDIPKINRYGFSIDIALSSSAEKILKNKNIPIPLQVRNILREKEEDLTCKTIEEIERLIVPAITQNTAIKLATGIQDQFIPRLLWQCLWEGKEVFLNFNQLLNYKGSTSKQPFIEEMMKSYIEKLKKMGVMPLNEKEYYFNFLDNKECSIENKEKLVADNVKKGKSHVIEKPQVITEKDISLLPKGQKQINLPRQTIITPLAYDKAKEEGIQLIKA